MAKSKSKKLIYIGIFVIGVILLLVPLITKNHIYQGVALGGDTMKCFIPMINSASDGNSMMSLVRHGGYLGLWVAMWVLGAMNSMLHINPEVLFYLYSICVLMGASITLYYLGKLVAGVRGGWIVMVMGMLCSTSILALYTWGCTVNIINVYIVFLWAVILLAKWWERHKWYWLSASGLLLLAFMFLHPTGAYLPFTIMVVFLGLIVWHLYAKQKVNWWYVIILVVVLGGSLYLTWHYMRLGAHNIFAIDYVNALVLGAHNIFDIDYLAKFFRLLLAPIPVVIGILTLITWLRNRKNIKFGSTLKIVLVILASLLVVLLGVSGLQATNASERQILDASAIMAIIIAILLAHLIKRRELQWLRASSYALMALGGLMTIHGWII